MVPAYLTIRAATERYGWSASAIYRMLGDGIIRAKKDGRMLLIEASSCDAYLAALPDAHIRRDKYRSRKAVMANEDGNSTAA